MKADCWKKLIPGFVGIKKGKNNQNPYVNNQNNDKPANHSVQNKNNAAKSRNQNDVKEKEACPCCGRTGHDLKTCIKFAALIQSRYGESGNVNLPGKNVDGPHGSPSSSQNPSKPTTSQSKSQ